MCLGYRYILQLLDHANLKLEGQAIRLQEGKRLELLVSDLLTMLSWFSL